MNRHILNPKSNEPVGTLSIALTDWIETSEGVLMLKQTNLLNRLQKDEGVQFL